MIMTGRPPVPLLFHPDATQAAVEEGIVPGGGVPLFYAAGSLDALKPANADQKGRDRGGGHWVSGMRGAGPWKQTWPPPRDDVFLLMFRVVRVHRRRYLEALTTLSCPCNLTDNA